MLESVLSSLMLWFNKATYSDILPDKSMGLLFPQGGLSISSGLIWANGTNGIAAWRISLEFSISSAGTTLLALCGFIPNKLGKSNGVINSIFSFPSTFS